MEWIKKHEIMDHYDRLFSIYDLQYGEEQNRKIISALEDVDVKKCNFVLDVGCGTGLLLEHIGESARLLVGLDISLRLLKVAAQRSKQFSDVALINADADYMPFPREIFDIVFAVTLLQNMPDVNRTLQEIARVSKKRTTIVITGLKKAFSKESFTRILEEASLKVSILKAGEERLLDYIAVCCKDKDK